MLLPIGRLPLTKRRCDEAHPLLANRDWQRIAMTYDIAIDDKDYRLDLKRAPDGWSCHLDGREVDVDAVLARPDVLSLRIANKAYEVKCERVGNEMHLWVGSV